MPPARSSISRRTASSPTPTSQELTADPLDPLATNPPIVLIHEDPSPIADLSVPDTVAHLESVIRGLDRPPFLMGHSFGGLRLQLLLDRGLGAAGVAIDSAPPEGIHKVPPAQIRALFPAFENPANRHRAVPCTLERFHYAFTNTLTTPSADLAGDDAGEGHDGLYQAEPVASSSATTPARTRRPSTAARAGR